MKANRKLTLKQQLAHKEEELLSKETELQLLRETLDSQKKSLTDLVKIIREEIPNYSGLEATHKNIPFPIRYRIPLLSSFRVEKYCPLQDSDIPHYLEVDLYEVSAALRKESSTLNRKIHFFCSSGKEISYAISPKSWEEFCRTGGPREVAKVIFDLIVKVIQKEMEEI